MPLQQEPKYGSADHEDELSKLIEPLLPPAKTRAKSDPRQPSVADRAAFNHILFMLITDIR